MHVQESPPRDRALFDEYPTLFTIPLRPAWLDEADLPEPSIVRSID
ncbi:hypothetical protein [Lentzea sp. NPDC051838]